MEITKPDSESHVPHIQILMNTERRFEHSLDNIAYNNAKQQQQQQKQNKTKN